MNDRLTRNKDIVKPQRPNGVWQINREDGGKVETSKMLRNGKINTKDLPRDVGEYAPDGKRDCLSLREIRETALPVIRF